MAYFRGVLQGQRGATSRLGSKSSGISAHIRSWNNDLHATLSYSDKNGEVFSFLLKTEGSSVAITVSPEELREMFIHHLSVKNSA